MLATHVIRKAVVTIVQNPMQFLRINLLWFLLTTFLSLPLFLWPQFFDEFSESPRDAPAFLGTSSVIPMIFLLGLILVSVVGWAIVSIAWHRFVIDGRQQLGWLLNGQNWPLSRYFQTAGLALLIGLVPMGALLWMTIDSWDQSAETMSHWAYFGSIFGAIFCLALPLHFFALTLSGIAVERRISLLGSLEATTPHILTILFLSVFCSLAYALPDTLITVFIGPTGHIEASLAGWLAFMLYMPTSWIAGVLAVGVFSELYLRLAEVK